jgi:hypothetical protein
MRKVYVYEGGKIVPKTPQAAPAARTQIIGDIDPYRSIATGEIINSRAQHRQHLRDNNLVEIGNEQQAKFGLPRS